MKQHAPMKKNVWYLLQHLDKRARYFLQYGLAVVLAGYIGLCANLFRVQAMTGLEEILGMLQARETAVVLAFCLLLVVCGGLFIDIAIKKEEQSHPSN